MSTAVQAQKRTANSGEQAADVLVVFGITGDLAKVMTFRSLYRLEKRGLLNCPIVGVAGDDWTLEHLREHARECIEGTGESLDPEVFERFAARLSYVSGDFTDAGHLRARRGRGRRRAESRLLSGDPAVPVRPRDQAAEGRRPDAGARASSSRSRSATTSSPRARWPRKSTSTSTSHSSTGSTTSSARWAPTSSSTCASPTR